MARLLGRNGWRLFNHLSLGVIDVIAAEDVDVTVKKDLGTLYVVTLYIVDTCRNT